jgi:MerR family redox-sensitive transcriptional activator SoxR
MPMPMRKGDRITIGALAARSGVATSAIRFYDELGLLPSERTSGGHRVFPRHALRRLALIRVAQRLGLSLDEIATALADLPVDHAATKADWARLSKAWRARLDTRIADLEALRDDLTSCIGCGCLSLATCGLYNPRDAAAAAGEGPRFLLGDDRDTYVVGRRGPDVRR